MTIEELQVVRGSMKPLTVETKEEYLAWVSHWKERYAWISAEIRMHRERRRFYRDERRAGRDGEEMWTHIRVAGWLSWTAHIWHALRLEGKRESWDRRCRLAGVPNERDPSMNDAEVEQVAQVI